MSMIMIFIFNKLILINKLTANCFWTQIFKIHIMITIIHQMVVAKYFELIRIKIDYFQSDSSHYIMLDKFLLNDY
ncbi:hypothetical protein B6D19_11925 [Gilliamella apicola]|nr:hypothetical protein B6D19_11925 [Gilliamella apicola]